MKWTESEENLNRFFDHANARIVVTPLFQMTFQFPKPFFGGFFVGADAFDSESWLYGIRLVQCLESLT
jgi:hypothetical protein